MRPAIISIITALFMMGSASAADITYRGVETFSGATIDLTLTTDGTTGNLSAGNFVSFSVNIHDAGGMTTINNANGELWEHICCGQDNTSATTTQIQFNYDDFVGGEFLAFQEGPIGAGGPFLCFSPNGCWGTIGYGYVGANSQPSSGGGLVGAVAAESGVGPIVIATAVPEPGDWMLLVGGIVAVGGVVRVRRFGLVSAR